MINIKRREIKPPAVGSKIKIQIQLCIMQQASAVILHCNAMPDTKE